MPGIDVAVPCYQYGRYLRDCVSSILAQDVDDLRVLIIDNASTDNSVEVARELARNDPRVEIVARQVNLGRHASYNQAIDWASAEYFMLIDADDVLAPGALKRALSVLERHPSLSFAHGYELWKPFDAGEKPETSPEPGFVEGDSPWHVSSGRQFIERMCHSGWNTVGTNTVVRRTSIQKQVGYYNPDLVNTDDMEMWLRLALAGDVAETRSLQTIRRIHHLQISTAFIVQPLVEFKERQKAFCSFISRSKEVLPDSERLQRLADSGLAKSALWTAVGHVRAGRIEFADELTEFAVKLSPIPVVARIIRRFWLFCWPFDRVIKLVKPDDHRPYVDPRRSD